MRSKSPNNTIINSSSGFTLLEVLISIAIMTAIAAGIFQITTKTFELRDKMMQESDFYNGIRMSMGIIDRDFSLLYSPVIMVPDDPKQQGPLSGQPMTPEELNAIMGNDQGRASSPYWEEAVHKTGIRPSRFQGTDVKMSFVTASNMRVYKESTESEFLKVSYELQDDKTPGAEPGTKILIRKSNADVFEDDDSALNPRNNLWRTYYLLPGVKKFKLQYYRSDRTTSPWFSNWDTDAQDTKYRYPDMVKLELEVVGPSRLHFEGTFFFRSEIPLRGLVPSG